MLRKIYRILITLYPVLKKPSQFLLTRMKRLNTLKVNDGTSRKLGNSRTINFTIKKNLNVYNKSDVKTTDKTNQAKVEISS